MDKQVLLFSGGMDSIIASKLFPDAQKLYLSIGSRYEDKEIQFIHQNFTDVQFDTRLRLGDLERDDAIIPARNLFFAAIASLYGNKILLSSVQGDMSTDKDQAFADHATSLLKHIYSPPHFRADLNVEVILPMKHASKVEWVEYYMLNGGDPVLLQDSVSCYSPDHHQCGQCKACIRKWVSLEANGIPTGGWHKHPSQYPWGQHIDQILNRTWRCHAEDMATESVLRIYKVI